MLLMGWRRRLLVDKLAWCVRCTGHRGSQITAINLPLKRVILNPFPRPADKYTPLYSSETTLMLQQRQKYFLPEKSYVTDNRAWPSADTAYICRWLFRHVVLLRKTFYCVKVYFCSILSLNAEGPKCGSDAHHFGKILHQKMQIFGVNSCGVYLVCKIGRWTINCSPDLPRKRGKIAMLSVWNHTHKLSVIS